MLKSSPKLWDTKKKNPLRNWISNVLHLKAKKTNLNQFVSPKMFVFSNVLYPKAKKTNLNKFVSKDVCIRYWVDGGDVMSRLVEKIAE